MKNKIDYYLSLPYSTLVKKINDESGEYYYARILELDGLQSDGSTESEALENLHEALIGYLETKIEFGDSINEPRSLDDYSGKINLRLPKSLHQQLAIQADMEGVSLNQYMLMKLSK